MTINSSKDIGGSNPLNSGVLQGSEKRFWSLIEAALEGILFLDADATITYANVRLARILGYDSPDEIIGEKVYFLFMPEDVEFARGRWSARLLGIQEEYELRLRGKDGLPRWTIAHVSIERDENELFLGTFTMFTDITERRLAIESLQAKNNEVVTIMESITDAFSSFDTDWRFTYLNPGAEQILGRSAEDLLGKCIWDEFPGSRETLVYSEYHRAIREQTKVAFEVYYGHLLGWFEVRAYPSATGLSAYFNDITKRKEAEADRERSAMEKTQLLAELQNAEIKQRRFLREMLYSLTEGRLRLCDANSDLPIPLTPACNLQELSAATLKHLRKRAEAVAEDLELPQERFQDLETGIGEAAMNAVLHAGGGDAQIRVDRDNGIIQVWITDAGKGISQDSLHRATLEKGYSSAGSLGHGFWLMLKTCDRIYLLTGPQGTTIVLEQERTPPQPAWMQEFATQ